jgi:cytochrome c oxidase subunit II
MTALITILSIILLFVVLVQIAKINEITAAMKGEDEYMTSSSEQNGKWLIIFCVLFLGSFVWSALYYANRMLGYGPLKSASEHGGAIDSMFNVTLVFTGIVFVICHLVLFWFPYKYRYRKDNKALFIPHDNRLEIIWTAVPALVMTILVVQGLVTWNRVMADVNADDDFIEIEATAWQFAWNLRYPGADGKLGVKDFRLIKPGVNELGQDWHDERNHDDYNADELVLPKGKKIRIRIIARDVLHNFYLPHFRVKMDAVPGIPTYFVFTPIKTSEEFRQELRKYSEYQLPSDPNDPNSDPKWKAFEYELACAELCGKGHYSMRRVVKVVSPEIWNKSQKAHYFTTIRNTDEDPFKGKPVISEAILKGEELKGKFIKALDTSSTNASDRIIQLDNIYFETGVANLQKESEVALMIIKEQFDKNPKLKVEIIGHTDNTGDPAVNLKLSQDRANSVRDYLITNGVKGDQISSSGVGSSRPLESNDTEEGRTKNRRIEFKILSF